MQIAFVLYPGLTTLDIVGPYEVLKMVPEADVRFVGNEVGPVLTDSGVLLLGATHTFAETPAPDIVVVPGSEGATVTAMTDAALTHWLAMVHRTTTWTVSVCSGALVLAAAGILHGHPATTHWMAQSALSAMGVTTQRDKRIVRSGKIVTAAGVSAGIDLGLWLVGELSGREHAELVQLAIEYDPQPPFDAGHPSKASSRVRHRARAELIRRGASGKEAVAIGTMAWRRAIDLVRGARE